MSATMLRGVCRCGADVSREAVEGWGAHILNGSPFLCARCEVGETERHEAEERSERQLADRERFEQKVQRIPKAFCGARLRDLDEEGRKKALEAAKRWAAGELLGLVMLGGVGRGKTTIAAAAAIDYMGRNLGKASPRWISTTLALSNLGRDFGDRERRLTIEMLTGKASPLVLDDLDKGKPSAFAAEQIFLAIDLATANGRPLVVTSNLMPSQLQTLWPKPHGEAIASRLAGYCEMYQITGVDRRMAR